MLSTPVIKGIEVIGPYHVLEDLGPAPFGTVYYTVDTRSDREAVLKVIPPSHPGHLGPLEILQEDTPWEILLHETRVLGRIYHRGIPSLLEIAEEEGVLLIASAPVEGMTLRELLQQGTRPDRAQLIDWGCQILDILGEAHAAGILHRHINEEEVVVAPEGHLVLTGFGLTHLVFDPIVSMPPEQLAGERYTSRSDLYAVGSLLRRLAFAGAWRSRLGSRVVGSRDPLLKVLARATFPDPAARFATAAEMADALREASRATVQGTVTVQGPVAVPDPRQSTGEVAVIQRSRPVRRPQPARPPKSEKPEASPRPEEDTGDRWYALLLFAATVLLMLLVIAAGWVLVGQDGSRNRPMAEEAPAFTPIPPASGS
jgi:serine/threonine protein kinase